MYEFKLKMKESDIDDIGNFANLLGMKEGEVEKLSDKIYNKLEKLYDEVCQRGDTSIQVPDMINYFHEVCPPGSREWEYFILYSVKITLHDWLLDIMKLDDTNIFGEEGDYDAP